MTSAALGSDTAPEYGARTWISIGRSIREGVLAVGLGETEHEAIAAAGSSGPGRPTGTRRRLGRPASDSVSAATGSSIGTAPGAMPVSTTNRDAITGLAGSAGTTGSQWATKRCAAGVGKPHLMESLTWTPTVEPATAEPARRGPPSW